MTPEIKQRIEQIQNGIVPKGYKQTPFGIYPANWVVGKLGDYIEEYSVLSNEIETYPVYSSSRKGLLLQSQYFDNREAVKTNLGYKMVPSGYVTYRHMSDDDIFYFNRNTTGKTILVSSEYPVFTNSEYGCLDYLITLLNNTSRFRYFCRTQKMGGTRTRLYFKRLCQYRTVFPHITEQLKISEILNTQDKVIELTEKRIEQLKQMKKYYLQNMFPKRGETVPKIRFKGFTDAWEQRKFSDITFPSGEKNKDNLPYESYSITNESGFVPQDEKFENGGTMRDADKRMYYIVSPQSFAYNPARINVGSIGYQNTHKNVIVSSLYEVFKTTDDVDDRFLWHWFKSDDFQKLIIQLQEGGVRLYFYYDKLCMGSIALPNLAEQRQIGAYLDKLDNLITLHQRKLEEEKRKKKSLAQLLLSGIVRVKV